MILLIMKITQFLPYYAKLICWTELEIIKITYKKLVIKAWQNETGSANPFNLIKILNYFFISILWG
jgi:hypothetical protein